MHTLNCVYFGKKSANGKTSTKKETQFNYLTLLQNEYFILGRGKVIYRKNTTDSYLDLTFATFLSRSWSSYQGLYQFHAAERENEKQRFTWQNMTK